MHCLIKIRLMKQFLWNEKLLKQLLTLLRPWAYDRRVPLVFWGPWQAARRAEPVRTVDLAPTLAHELGLRPGTVDGRVLDLAASR